MILLGKRSVPLHELRFVFARSSGAGGQNVNKTSTKVTVYWSVVKSHILSATEKDHLMQKLQNRLTSRGELLVSSETERSQLRNRDLAVARLNDLVNRALQIKIKRRPTKPTYTSKIKRLEGKKIRSRIKQSRRIFSD